MPGSSNSSFIPKRNPQQAERRDPRRQVFIGTFVIRVLFFAVLISSVVLYFYEKSLAAANTEQVIALDTAIASFDEVEMQRVINIHNKLTQVSERLSYSASVNRVLESVESAVTDSSYITELALERADTSLFEVDLTVRSKDFNTVIFQEEVAQNSDILEVTEILDLSVQPANAVPTENQEATEFIPPGTITYSMLIHIDPATVPHRVQPTSAVEALPVPTEPVSEAQATTSNETTL